MARDRIAEREANAVKSAVCKLIDAGEVEPAVLELYRDLPLSEGLLAIASHTGTPAITSREKGEA